MVAGMVVGNGETSYVDLDPKNFQQDIAVEVQYYANDTTVTSSTYTFHVHRDSVVYCDDAA